jgi:hypothetical protein
MFMQEIAASSCSPPTYTTISTDAEDWSTLPPYVLIIDIDALRSQPLQGFQRVFLLVIETLIES